MLLRRARQARGRLNCPLPVGIRGPKGPGSGAPEQRTQRGPGLEEARSWRRPAPGWRWAGQVRGSLRLAGCRPAFPPRREGSALLSRTIARFAAAGPHRQGSRQLSSTPQDKTMAQAGAPYMGPEAWFAFYTHGLEVRPSGLWRLVEGWSDSLRA